MSSSIGKIKNSRDGWKSKAKDRGYRLRQARRQERRDKLRITHLEQEILRLHHSSPAQDRCTPHAAVERPSTQALCLMMVLQASVSFRAVPRVLRLMQPLLGQLWIPHFTSVINWSLRLGLALLKAAEPIAQRWLAIMDCSIDLGARKVLVILRVPLDAMKRGRALRLSDCECIGVRIAPTWNGERVSAALAEIFTQVGTPAAILKDQGGDLSRGVQLWCANKQLTCPVIDDVGHYFGNALKNQYERRREFKTFMDLVYRGSSQIKHTELAALQAPRLGSHGRFLKLPSVAAWAEKIIATMEEKVRSEANSLGRRLFAYFSGFLKLRRFLKRFLCDCGVVNECQTLLKNHGLNQHSYEDVRQRLESLPKNSEVRSRLMSWLDRQMVVRRKLELGELALPVSSDVIECLMGRFKTIIQRCHAGEFNRLSLVFPALCGMLNESALEDQIKSVSQKELLEWQHANVPITLRQLRRRNLPSKKRMTQGPKTEPPAPG